MSIARPVIWLILLCGVPLRGAAGADPVELPADPSVSVIEFGYVEPGQHSLQPEISIYSSGRVWCRVEDGAIWGEMSRQNLGQLVQQLLQGDGLNQLTTESIRSDLDTESRRTNLTAEISGAASSIIRIRTARTVVEVSAPAVGLLSSRFPEARLLQKFAVAERRLMNVRAVVMVGGPEAAGNLARLACQRVGSEYGEDLTVTLQDLTLVRTLADGTRYCQFVIAAPDTPPTGQRIISLFESPGETPRVSVVPEGRPLR